MNTQVFSVCDLHTEILFSASFVS